MLKGLKGLRRLWKHVLVVAAHEIGWYCDVKLLWVRKPKVCRKNKKFMKTKSS